MLRYAKEDDTKVIYQMWKEIFSFDDSGYTDYYFQHNFKPCETMVKEVNNEIVSIATKSRHCYQLKNRLVNASMIYGVATVEEERGKGYMNEILVSMLDQLSHQELITLIQAYDPSRYYKYGFEMAYHKKEFTLTKDNVEEISTHGCTKELHPVDLLCAYGRFCSLFDGYQIRDEDYFENYMKEVRAQNGDVVAYIEHKKFQGYACLYDKGDHIVIDEIIYYDVKTLLKLVNLALRIRPKVLLHVSEKEPLEKIFKNAPCRTYGYTLIRVNDIGLFNRLYETNVRTTKEAIESINKPLFLKEER